MALLIHLMKVFVAFAGITPPTAENERRVAVICFVILCVIAMGTVAAFVVLTRLVMS
jgi:hypothetical protein